MLLHSLQQIGQADERNHLVDAEAQTNVSQRIRELEATLETPLLKFGPGRLGRTLAGRVADGFSETVSNRASRGPAVSRRLKPQSAIEGLPVRAWLVIALAALCLPAEASPASPKEAELYASLMDWAIKLSGYSRPADVPVVEFVPQSFFDANACGGRHCRVWGWYPNTRNTIVYVHESARDLLANGADPRSLLAASILVHEFTHFLQASSRGFAPYDCAAALSLEREAYAVQNAYIAANGSFIRVGVSMHGAGCDGNAHAEHAVAPP